MWHLVAESTCSGKNSRLQRKTESRWRVSRPTKGEKGGLYFPSRFLLSRVVVGTITTEVVSAVSLSLRYKAGASPTSGTH